MPGFDATLFLALQHSRGSAATHETVAPGRRHGRSERYGVAEGPEGRLVPRVGFEPTAYRLRSGCSTTELSGLALGIGRVPIATEIGPVQVLSAAADPPENGAWGRRCQGEIPPVSWPRQPGISPVRSTRNTHCRIAVKRSFAGCLFPTRVPTRECWNAGAPPSLAVTIPTPGSPVFGWMLNERPFGARNSVHA